MRHNQKGWDPPPPPPDDLFVFWVCVCLLIAIVSFAGWHLLIGVWD